MKIQTHIETLKHRWEKYIGVFCYLQAGKNLKVFELYQQLASAKYTQNCTNINKILEMLQCPQKP